MPSTGEVFTEAEWATLRYAPFWVLTAIAGRQSRFEEVEVEAFTEAVELAGEQGSGVVASAFGRVALDLDRLFARYATERRASATGLWQVGELLRRLPDAEAAAFRAALVSGVGEAVARSRGRYGRMISEDDAKIVELVATLLS